MNRVSKVVEIVEQMARQRAAMIEEWLISNGMDASTAKDYIIRDLPNGELALVRKSDQKVISELAK